MPSSQLRLWLSFPLDYLCQLSAPRCLQSRVGVGHESTSGACEFKGRRDLVMATCAAPRAHAIIRDVTTPELKRTRLRQVGHSLNMIAELPRYVQDPRVSYGLQVAAVDSFFVHQRLLIEFLVRRQAQNDIHRDDYTTGFSLQTIDPGLAAKLDGEWELASRHVVHFSDYRVPQQGSLEVQYMSAADLVARAADIFTTADLFQQHLSSSQNIYTGDFKQLLGEAKHRLLRRPRQSGSSTPWCRWGTTLRDSRRTTGSLPYRTGICRPVTGSGQLKHTEVSRYVPLPLRLMLPGPFGCTWLVCAELLYPCHSEPTRARPVGPGQNPACHLDGPLA